MLLPWTFDDVIASRTSTRSGLNRPIQSSELEELLARCIREDGKCVLPTTGGGRHVRLFVVCRAVSSWPMHIFSVDLTTFKRVSIRFDAVAVDEVLSEIGQFLGTTNLPAAAILVCLDWTSFGASYEESWSRLAYVDAGGWLLGLWAIATRLGLSCCPSSGVATAQRYLPRFEANSLDVVVALAVGGSDD